MTALLENLGLGGLRVPKVHHLIEELEDDDEIVADGLLLQLLEVLGQHFDKLVQKDKNGGGIGVSPSERQHCRQVSL
jgi:hypothetical protein